MAKKFLIIGVGRFGKSVVKELFELGYDVVACDTNEQLLEEVDDYTQFTVVGDAREDSILEGLNVDEFDSVIVTMGDDFESAVYIVAKLKALKCKNILAKANDHFRGNILETVGADKVIYPEEETGKRLARQVVNPGILEFVAIDQHSSVLELEVPENFVGKTLIQLDLRRKYSITVVAISHSSSDSLKKRYIASPSGDEVFQKGDILIAIGENKDLERFRKKMC